MEFHKCLAESQIGFSDRQITHMMNLADFDGDGSIDYGEFQELYWRVLLELARSDEVDRLFADDAAHARQLSLSRYLDELMIPLHIGFDLTSNGSEEDCDTSELVQLLLHKGEEWGVHPDATQQICHEVMAVGEAISWPRLVEVIEKLAAGSPTGADAAAEGEAAA